ncbi:MAG: FG-GAP repeat protein [Bryobacteraceae bacterium]|nr:FG-GAP repeat protein [Bryobacteraceae bacterium]
MKTHWKCDSMLRWFGAAVLAAVLGVPAMAQNVAVTAADPAAAEQGTLQIPIKITGRGFRAGAQARFSVTGTTNPGGVTVLSTTYVSNTELHAMVDIADNAQIDLYDIEVQNVDGRGGKGMELFSVTEKTNGGGVACALLPLDPKFTLVATIQSDSTAGREFGRSTGLRRMNLNGHDVLVAAIGTRGDMIEVMVLDASTGAPRALDGAPLNGGPAPSLRLPYSGVVGAVAMGDVNADGVPDILAGRPASNTAYLYVGSIDGGQLAYSPGIAIHQTSGAPQWVGGGSIAIGDLDATAGDELAIGDIGGGGKGKNNGTPGRIHLYRYNASTASVSYIRSISSPFDGQGNDRFGMTLGIYQKELLAASPLSSVNGVSGAGRGLVFPNPLVNSNYIEFPGRNKDDNFGRQPEGALLVTGHPGYLFSTAWNNSSTRSEWHARVLPFGSANPVYTVQPEAGYHGGWNTSRPAVGDIDGDGIDDIVIGAANATSTGCQPTASNGTVYIYLSTLGFTRIRIEPPDVDPDWSVFGWSVATEPGARLLLVGEPGRDHGSVSNAGRVYVYRVNN